MGHGHVRPLFFRKKRRLILSSESRRNVVLLSVTFRFLEIEDGNLLSVDIDIIETVIDRPDAGFRRDVKECVLQTGVADLSAFTSYTLHECIPGSYDEHSFLGPCNGSIDETPVHHAR